MGGFASVIQDPKFATGVGLVLYGARNEPVEAEFESTPVRGANERTAGHFGRLFERVKGLF